MWKLRAFSVFVDAVFVTRRSEVFVGFEIFSLWAFSVMVVEASRQRPREIFGIRRDCIVGAL
jgi:hypothetical protein